jgi:ATP-dependent protease HslVU (ClpYQ) peptidase subunit
MTTLAAYQGDGWAVIGADSRATDDTGRIFDLSNHKIVENGAYLIAVSGSSRGGNIAQQGWVPPKPPLTNDVNKLDVFMTKKFIPQLRKAFINAGFDGKEDGEAAWQDSGFLVVVNGIIYPIFNDYSWDRDIRGIYYSGSGGDVALGAMAALNIQDSQDEHEASQILYKAIEKATEFDAYTSAPIHIRIQYAR